MPDDSAVPTPGPVPAGHDAPKPTEEQPPTERIVISLRDTLRADVMIRLLKAINREFPGARWLPSDVQGNLVIGVDAKFADGWDDNDWADVEQ
jgi:hypothetical protein